MYAFTGTSVGSEAVYVIIHKHFGLYIERSIFDLFNIWDYGMQGGFILTFKYATVLW